LISDPGDSVFHYGLPWPPTVEEYIELLRTEWADHIFVFAGGADPGGSLFPYVPLELDIYSEPFACPPSVAVTNGFLLLRDYYPLGALPGDEDYGDETIPWADTMSYPLGYPIDGNAWHEEQYALWPIDGYMNAICTDPNFSMRVRVTDHVGNWKRSGMIENMQIGIPGTDKGISDLRFYSETALGLPDYLFEYCDNDCDDPQSCDPDNKYASSIAYRDADGECALHLVAVYPYLKAAPPSDILAEIESNESMFPDDANESLTVQMNLVGNENIILRFNDLFGYPPYFACEYAYYIGSFDVSDAVHPVKLYVSHGDEAYLGYPVSDVCQDYTLISDIRPKEGDDPDYVDYAEIGQFFVYGTKRGWDLDNCDPSEGSYYAEDRLIQVGGFHVVFASIDGATTTTGDALTAEQGVQSAADLIIVSSHGYVGPDDAPMGISCVFSGRTGGCECPPHLSPFRDSTSFSPLPYPSINPSYDDDFEDNPDDNGDFGGDFWQQQDSHDSVTWVLFLGCDILSDDARIGYSPQLKWTEHIGTANVLCGYSRVFASNPVFQTIGNLFSNRMENALSNQEMPPPGSENLYISEDIIPGGYEYRPVRAWMEANCIVANQEQFKDPQDEHTNTVKKCITSAVAIDMEMKVWYIDDKDKDLVYNIYVQ